MPCFTHAYHNPQRFNRECSALKPPLELDRKWQTGLVRYQPKLLDGSVFLTGLDGSIRAFNEVSAEPQWEFRLPGPLGTSGRDGYLLLSGRTLVTRQADQLYVLNAETGRLQAQHPVPFFDLQSGAFQDNRLYAIDVTPELDAYCVGYDIERAAELWRHPLRTVPDFITVKNGAVLLNSGEAEVSCLAADNGEVLWNSKLKRLFEAENSNKSDELKVAGPIFAFADLAIVGVQPHYLAAVSIADGGPRWLQRLNVDSVRRTATCAPDLLYVLGQKSCYSIAADRGSVLTVADFAGEVKKRDLSLLTLPAATEHHLFFADIYSGLIVALDLATATIDWSFQCKAKVPILNAPVAAGRHLFVVDANGNFYAFLCS